MSFKRPSKLEKERLRKIANDRELNSPAKPLPFEPNSSRILRCHNEYFTAGSVWEKRDGIWSCSKAAPIIKWMIGMEPSTVKMELIKRGCQWEWI